MNAIFVSTIAIATLMAATSAAANPEQLDRRQRGDQVVRTLNNGRPQQSDTAGTITRCPAASSTSTAAHAVSGWK